MKLDGCVPFPEEFADRYRREGYWRGDRLGDLLRRWAQAGGDRPAVSAGRVRMSYAELDAAADRLAFGLRRLGLRRGDRVVVQLPNVVEFPAVCFSLLRLGALPVFALPPHREHEINHLVVHSEAVAYLACDTFGAFAYGELGAAARKASPALRHVLLLDGPDDERNGVVDLRRLLDDPVDTTEARDAADADPPDPSDVAFFLLSGGTTGLPKLIPRTHDDYAYNVAAAAEVSGTGPSTVYLVALPAAHNFPLGCPGLMGTLATGGRVVMAPSPRPEDAMAAVDAERVTITALVPALVIRWLEANAERRFDLSSLEVLQVGGARLAPEVARRIGPAIGCRLQQVFGMAEGLLNYTRLDDPDDVVTETQGRPLSPADEILVVGPDGRPVADGEPGELLTRGPYTIRGYYRAEAHNASAFTPDGFYRTGDIVRRDRGGNFIVEGRAKDLINRGGEKISAEEIENLLLAHPAVREAAAVAMPHPVLGEQTCAYVVLRPDEPLDLPALSTYLEGRGVARFKWPERLEVVDALPVTNVGKVDKKKLREDIAAKLAALEDFYAELRSHHLEALWRINTKIMPFAPRPRARAWLWRYRDLAHLSELAGKLVPIDRGGDRRVLAAVNPGLVEAYGDSVYGATATLWGAVQYLGPHESAPGHRHSPSALRFVVEGSGAWTTVDGVRLNMAPGDLVLTPAYAWHDHQNDSGEPMTWFDGLDLPLACYLDAQFFEFYPTGELQEPGCGGSPPPVGARPGVGSPLLRYPWRETEVALEAQRSDPDPHDDVLFRYINPATGGPVLPTLDAAIQLVRAGVRTAPHRHVHSVVYQVFRGRGQTIVDGVRFTWERGDIVALPPWAVHEHHAPDGDALLFSITDAPVLTALGLERVVAVDEPQAVTGDFGTA